MNRWTLTAVTGLFAVQSAIAQEVRYEYVGIETGSALGTAAASIDDLDRDGVRDFLFSTPYSDGWRGRVEARSGATGAEIFHRVGPSFGKFPKGYGFELNALGDVDADGVPDFVVGLTGYMGREVHVLSGIQGRRIHRIEDAAAGGYGEATAALGDVDGDGHADLAVSAHMGGNPSGTASGFVRVYSGRDAAMLYQVSGGGSKEHFGLELTSISDVDGDGVRELVISAVPETDVAAFVRVVSGATGAPLYSRRGLSDDDLYGISLDTIADRDGDGLEEFVVGAVEDVTYPTGYVQILSGVDGSVLATFRGRQIGESFGTRVASAGDVDGDGLHDLLVTSRQQLFQGDFVQLLSGTDGAVLYRFDAQQESDAIGAALAGLGDLDGDGLGEIAIGAPSMDYGRLRDQGRLTVYAGNDLYLLATPRSVVAGDTITLETRRGAVRSPVLVAVTGIDGVPRFQVVTSGILDRRGAFKMQGIIPPGIAGITVQFRSLNLTPAGSIAASSDEQVRFQ